MTPFIDTAIDWPLQYAGDSSTFPAEHYPEVRGRLGQLAGYLQTTRAAFVAASRSPADWARLADPWAGLCDVLARVEAEFPGRVLIGPDDWDRWNDDRDGLTWAVLGVGGMGGWLRTADDLPRLGELATRGVRWFALGSDGPDDAGLSDLDRAALETLAGLAGAERHRALAVNLSGLGPRALGEALAWFESDPARTDRLIPLLAPAGDDPGPIGRLRALGGVVGVGVGRPAIASAEALRARVEATAAAPSPGRTGFEGVALASGFLGTDATPKGLGNAPEVVAWAGASFEPAQAAALLHGTARELIRRLVGVA